VLATLGHRRLRNSPQTVGFGKRYPEFWLNHRPGMTPVAPDSGAHICLRAASAGAVDAFYRAALDAGGRSAGAPGRRPEYSDRYYAAFVRDPEGNRIEAVTFLTAEK
jgi:catechol 2,3-dioxygenase-like lactoylglutathione lyase family enzyme